MSAIETEVKFPVADGATLERRLSELGFHQVTPRTFERNILFDTPNRELRSRQEILRVRKYGDSWVLTHKCVPEHDDPAGRHKNRVETETRVDDGEAVATVFEHLGFKPAFTYEKWRSEWADTTGHCVIDETPIGLFAELEGPSDWIDETGAQLGIDPSQFMTLSYGRLFELWQQKNASSATDLTFESVAAAARH
jgi:adenylate cyclase, class 2